MTSLWVKLLFFLTTIGFLKTFAFNRIVQIGKDKYQLLQFKGCLISEKCSLCLNSPKKVPNHHPECYPPKEKMLRIVIWNLFFWDLSQIKKLSEIKPPLVDSFSWEFLDQTVYLRSDGILSIYCFMIIFKTGRAKIPF